MRLLHILFALIIFFAYFFGIGSYGLLDKDEPRYCGAALEMIENNNWIVPKFNFQDRFDKPALFYWMIAASYKVFGINDFTSRLPSALCAVFLVLFTWYTAKKIFGKNTGFLSAVILATSVEFILLGRRAATDMALCLFFSGSLYSILLSYYIKDIKIKIFWTILAGIFSGLSVLTKGPVGILLPLIILTVFLFLRKQFDIKHLKIYFIICFFAGLVSVPWYFSVHYATCGAFTKEFFFTHNLNRFTSVVGEHPGPVWFYIPVILGGFMPWTLFFIDSIIHLALEKKRIFKKSFNKFLLFNFIWIMTVFIFFSLSKTKLATYILLIFPPLAQITAYWICILGRKGFVIIKRVVLLTLLFITPALIYGLYLILKWKLDTDEKNTLFLKLFICVAFIAGGMITSFIFSKKYYSFILLIAFSLSVPVVFGITSYLNPYYKHTHLDLKNFAILAREKGAKEIISFGMFRPSLVYYSRIPVNFDQKNLQIKKIKELSSQGQKVFIIGHSSDIEKHKNLFSDIKIIDLKKKYFIGVFN